MLRCPSRAALPLACCGARGRGVCHAHCARAAEQDAAEAHARWEEASEAVAALCQRCSGAQQARLIQTANQLVALGLEGFAPGARRPGAQAGACVELPADRGVRKLIGRLAPLCCQNATESAGRLQKLVGGGDGGCDASAEPLVGCMVACTQFVADGCTALLLSPEECGVAQCASLRGVMPLLDSCIPTLDAALALAGVARKMQVPAPAIFPPPPQRRAAAATLRGEISPCTPLRPAAGNWRGGTACGALAADVSGCDGVRARAVGLAGRRLPQTAPRCLAGRRATKPRGAGTAPEPREGAQPFCRAWHLAHGGAEAGRHKHGVQGTDPDARCRGVAHDAARLLDGELRWTVARCLDAERRGQVFGRALRFSTRCAAPSFEHRAAGPREGVAIQADCSLGCMCHR